MKRAKLNLRNSEDVKAFHRGIFERRFGGFVDGTLVDVYIDITGYKETYKRPEMLRLMRDCANGKVNLIFSGDERLPCGQHERVLLLAPFYLQRGAARRYYHR